MEAPQVLFFESLSYYRRHPNHLLRRTSKFFLKLISQIPQRASSQYLFVDVLGERTFRAKHIDPLRYNVVQRQ